jgi:hypothetical protein
MNLQSVQGATVASSYSTTNTRAARKNECNGATSTLTRAITKHEREGRDSSSAKKGNVVLKIVNRSFSALALSRKLRRVSSFCRALLVQGVLHARRFSAAR